MTTNSGIWTGWNNFYGSGDYAITGDTLNISTNAANMSALLYWSTVAKPGERITIEYDARTISGVGRMTASSRVAYTAYNAQLIGNHSDFRSYTFDVEVPTKSPGRSWYFSELASGAAITRQQELRLSLSCATSSGRTWAAVR